MDSYSVRCLFRWRSRPGQAAAYLYEERITLWSASGLDEAIALAEQEAGTYADEGIEYLGLAQAYALVDTLAGHGVEVFSLLRDSDLAPEQYLAAFFDTGAEHTQRSS